MVNLKDLTQAAFSVRARLANVASKTFGSRRDLYKTLGYQRQLYPIDYRSRYMRNEIANRIVKARPLATWRGGCEVVEDLDPTKENETAFEQAFVDLDNRLKIWDTFKRADILAGIGRYAVILLGGPGELDQPMESCSADDLAYLTPYSEEDATIERFEVDRHNPRYGKPVFYNIKRTQMSAANAVDSFGVGKRVHYSRIIHVADGLLDDQIYGEPRLQCIWNVLDDIEKVRGGGAEAFWRRADKGIQFDIDPTLDVDQPAKDKMATMIDEYEHDMRRYLMTRGMTIKELGSDVADFKSPVESLMSLVSVGCGIPQRVLMGSEQGKLAAKQDRANWDNQITDRQRDYAGPCIVRPFTDRLIELGTLPTPTTTGYYDVSWSSIITMDDEQKADIATDWSRLDAVTRDELRERVLNLEPLGGELGNEILGSAKGPAAASPLNGAPLVQPTVAKAKGGPAWKSVHQAADRFRTAGASYHQRLLRRRSKEVERDKPAPRTESEEPEGGRSGIEWGD